MLGDENKFHDIDIVDQTIICPHEQTAEPSSSCTESWDLFVFILLTCSFIQLWTSVDFHKQ